MLGHGAGIGYTGPDGPIDNFSLVTGSVVAHPRMAMGKMRNCVMRKVKCGMKNVERW